MTNLYTVKETAELLKLPETTIYDWLQSGRLKAYKLATATGKPGKLWRIPETSITQILIEGN